MVRVTFRIVLAAAACVTVSAAPLEAPGRTGAASSALESRPTTLLEGWPSKLEASLQVAAQQTVEWGRDFYFTRAIYSSYRGGRRRASWATDYPKADRQFLYILHRLLTLLDAHEMENPVSLADPELRRYPFLYMLEVGWMNLTEPEVLGLRGYLEAGGFLVVDDFWGYDEWGNFEQQMARVLPDRKIQPIPMDHSIFHQFYDIDEVLQVPNLGNGARGGPYGECRPRGSPCDPAIFGIFDDHGELMVVINHNTDLGDAWEWSENPYYPFDRSKYAYELAINYIIYGLSH